MPVKSRKLLLLAVPIVLLGMAFPSCMTVENYKLDVLYPAKVTVPPHVKSLVVVDNVFPLPDSVEVVVGGSKGQYIRPNIDTIPHIVFKKLESTLVARNFFDSVYCYPLSLNLPPRGRVNKPISAGDIRDLQYRYHADALLVLNNYSVKPKLEYTDVSEAENFFYVSQSVGVSLSWTLIDLKNDSVIDVHVQKDTLFWDAYTDRLIYPIKGLMTFRASVEAVADYMGYYYADRITPNWVREDRYYFRRENGYWSLANDHIAKNEWEEAGKVWFHLYSQANKTAQAKLAHNIAFACEMQGKYEEAAKWAFESLNYFRELSIGTTSEISREQTYYKKMVKRVVDAERLSKQVGVL